MILLNLKTIINSLYQVCNVIYFDCEISNAKLRKFIPSFNRIKICIELLYVNAY